MNWIRIARNIKNDPRILTLAARCRIRAPEAVGLVVNLLVELPDNAADGDVSNIEDFVLEQWAGWTGDIGLFAEHFRTLLCDGAGVVRAWEKHNGSAMREAEAARERMRVARAQKSRPRPTEPEGDSEQSAEHEPHDTRTPADISPDRSPDRSANERRTVRRTFASNGTERNDIPTPSSPDGSEGPPSTPDPNRSESGPLFAEWERQLFAAAQPHEVAALEHLASKAFRPAVIGELYAIASGQHVVRGAHTGREATAADVMRAVSELACKPNREWNQSYFRGVVRRILDRPPEPPDQAERERQRLEKAAMQLPTAALFEAPRSPEEIEAGRARREAAMAHFRAEAMRNRSAA